MGLHRGFLTPEALVCLAAALSSLGFGHQEGLHPGQRSPGYENVIPALISR
jgi:hypothetical protein